MEKREYEKYVISLLTTIHKIQLYTNKNRKQILEVLIRFHQSIIFSVENNYFDVLKQDYENYVSSDWMRVLSEFLRYNESHSKEVYDLRISGEYFKTQYYVRALKFENYRCVSKHLKQEFRYYIKATNNGLYGRIPILKRDEENIVNEAFRILQYHYNDYCGLCSIKYINSPFYYLSHEEIIEMYENLLEKYKTKE